MSHSFNFLIFFSNAVTEEALLIQNSIVTLSRVFECGTIITLAAKIKYIISYLF